MDSVANLAGAFNCEDFLQDNQLVFHDAVQQPFIVAGVRPLDHTVLLTPADDSEFFFENLEAGVVNLGGEGSVSADGAVYQMEPLSCTYLGKGTTDVKFYSSDPDKPAVFLLIATRAKFAYPNHMVKLEEATPAEEIEELHAINALTYLRPAGIQSCQLQMGICVNCKQDDFMQLAIGGAGSLACYRLNNAGSFYIWSVVSS